jgi:hypothetical protein
MSQSEQILPIDAVARANGVRPTRYLASLRFFIFPFRMPDEMAHSQALPLVSLEVRPFPSHSFHTCRLNTTPRLAIIGSRLGLSRNKTFIAGTSESVQAPVPTKLPIPFEVGGRPSSYLLFPAFPLHQYRLLRSSLAAS